MNAFRHIYSLTLGLIIGVLSAFTVAVLGILGITLWGVNEYMKDKEKNEKKSEKKPTGSQQFYYNNHPSPVSTDEEIKQALSEPADEDTKSSIDPRAGVPAYRLFDGNSREVGVVINEIMDRLRDTGYMTINEVMVLTRRDGNIGVGNTLGWTNDEININTIEMAPKTEPANRGLYTLILPKPVDITSFLTAKDK